MPRPRPRSTVPGSGPADRYWLERAIDLSRLCPQTTEAYSVGAVIVAADGSEVATGYSRETDLHVHAEESALAKCDPADPRLIGATVYSTLEPCSVRRSRPRACAELIIAAGPARVVIAWREPALFVVAQVGVERLVAAGIVVIQLPELAAAARAVNAHLALEGGPDCPAGPSLARPVAPPGQ